MLDDHDHDTMNAIRDLIGEHPLNAELLEDRASWDRLCRGLDGVEDADTPSGRLSALNDVRVALGMEPVVAESAETDAAVLAGLEGVKAELEERVNAFYERHSEPLSALFHETVRYQYEKACAAARACIPGERRETSELDRVLGTKPLLRSFERFVAELGARGYDADVRSIAEDALYILRRSQAVMDGAVDIDPRDVYLLVEHALGPLIDAARELAAEIDESTAKREPGWTPPGTDEG